MDIKMEAKLEAIQEACRNQKFLWSMLEEASEWELADDELCIHFPESKKSLAEMLQARDPMNRLRSVVCTAAGAPLFITVALEGQRTNCRYGLCFYSSRCYDDRQGNSYVDLRDVWKKLESRDDELRASLTGFVALRVLLEVLKEGWTLTGWEGDGRIECTMLPPYVFNTVDDGCWVPVFHVKQSDNGTSFVACSEPMLSDDLLPAEFAPLKSRFLARRK
jgi:hypothetical protein